MTPEQFCYWLQGYSELGGPVPTEEQWRLIKEHLGLVFTKVTSPNIPTIYPWGVPNYVGPNDKTYHPEITC